MKTLKEINDFTANLSMIGITLPQNLRLSIELNDGDFFKLMKEILPQHEWGKFGGTIEFNYNTPFGINFTIINTNYRKIKTIVK